MNRKIKVVCYMRFGTYEQLNENKQDLRTLPKKQDYKTSKKNNKNIISTDRSTKSYPSY